MIPSGVYLDTPGRRSVYRFCTAQEDPTTGRRFLSQPSPFGYRELDDTRTHTVGEGDTLFTLAARYYPGVPNASRLYRVIGLFQPEPIHDPSLRIETGRVLFIPSLRTVDEEVFTEARRADYEAGA